MPSTNKSKTRILTGQFHFVIWEEFEKEPDRLDCDLPFELLRDRDQEFYQALSDFVVLDKNKTKNECYGLGRKLWNATPGVSNILFWKRHRVTFRRGKAFDWSDWEGLKLPLLKVLNKYVEGRRDLEQSAPLFHHLKISIDPI